MVFIGNSSECHSTFIQVIMKNLIIILLLITCFATCYGQNEIESTRRQYPSHLDKFIPVKLNDINMINEEYILNNLPGTFPFLDSLQSIKLKCIALHRFTMCFYRQGENGIIDVPSDENRISFNMRLILKSAQVGDIILIDYIECVISNYDYKRREGVYFKIVE